MAPPLMVRPELATAAAGLPLSLPLFNFFPLLSFIFIIHHGTESCRRHGRLPWPIGPPPDARSAPMDVSDQGSSPARRRARRRARTDSESRFGSCPLFSFSLTVGTPPNTASSAGAAGQVPGPARRRACRRSRTAIGTEMVHCDQHRDDEPSFSLTIPLSSSDSLSLPLTLSLLLILSLLSPPWHGWKDLPGAGRARG